MSVTVLPTRLHLERLDTRDLPSGLLPDGFALSPSPVVVLPPSPPALTSVTPLRPSAPPPPAVSQTAAFTRAAFNLDQFVTEFKAAKFHYALGGGKWTPVPQKLPVTTIHRQAEADLRQLLTSLRNDPDMQRVRWAAYAVATSMIETGYDFDTGAENISKADATRQYAGKNGNRTKADAYTFRGRGYVQLTGRGNYDTLGRRLGIDLLSDPKRASDPATAYRILSVGMREGLFTRKGLPDFIWGDRADYTNARRIINGTDRAREVGFNAAVIEGMLTRAGYATYEYRDRSVRSVTLAATATATAQLGPALAFQVPAGAYAVGSGSAAVAIGPRQWMGGGRVTVDLVTDLPAGNFGADFSQWVRPDRPGRVTFASFAHDFGYTLPTTPLPFQFRTWPTTSPRVAAPWRLEVVADGGSGWGVTGTAQTLTMRDLTVRYTVM